MEKIKVTGKIASQPVVLNTTTEFAVFILIRTEKNEYKEFYYSDHVLHNIGRNMTNSTFTHIALSSVGDSVEIEIQNFDEKTNKITNFQNFTKKLGTLTQEEEKSILLHVFHQIDM